jgi:hypothetical protein
LSRDYTTGATLATTGVTTVPAIPIPPRAYDVWADDTWAGIGTTKLLACYRMNLNLGDKYDPDAPINSALTSFESVLEKEDQDYGSDASFGFDAAAVGLINSFKNGAKKYFRVKAPARSSRRPLITRFKSISRPSSPASASSAPRRTVPLWCCRSTSILPAIRRAPMPAC